MDWSLGDQTKTAQIRIRAIDLHFHHSNSHPLLRLEKIGTAQPLDKLPNPFSTGKMQCNCDVHFLRQRTPSLVCSIKIP
jgi:hypothetical protein